MGDPVVEGGRRWRVLWVHHEAEELRVHYRATIPRETARHVVRDLLASGRVPPVQATLPGTPLPRSQPELQRFWGTVRRHDETCYLTLFINDCCLLFPAGSRDATWRS